MSAQHLDELRSTPLLQDASEPSFATLVRGAYVQNYPRHTELITEGERADFLHIVSSGTVELFGTWQGSESCMSLLGPNDTFILAATIKDRPYQMSARTLEKSRIILIPSSNVRDVFECEPGFAVSILDELANCYGESIQNSKNMKFRKPIERLADFVLEQHVREGASGGFALGVEKKKLASFLGMTPENLSRSFSALRGHGVEVSGQVVTLSDPNALEVLARPNALSQA